MEIFDIYDWGCAEWLWLLLVCPVVLAIYWALTYLRRYKLRKFGNPETIRELMPNYSSGRGWLKVSLFVAALALLIIALARPRIGSKLASTEVEGREVMLVVDVSNSMLADDVKPSRIARTQYSIEQMLKVMKGDGIGIVAFAEEPRVVLPVRADYRSVASKLKSLTPSLIENQGTNIGAAIEAAALNFSSASAKSKSRVMIIISDGEAHDSAAVEAAKRCADSGITICAIGIGNPAGVPLTIDGEFIEDDEGNYVVTKLNEELMQEIASVGNGAYVRSSNEEFGLNTILKHLDEMETSTISIKYVEYKEYFQWFVGAALLILAIEALILPRRNPRLKGIHLFDRENNK